jgi:histone H3/H4
MQEEKALLTARKDMTANLIMTAPFRRAMRRASKIAEIAMTVGDVFGGGASNRALALAQERWEFV